MEQEKIRELLDKYFGGETSEDEERILREYLGSGLAPTSGRFSRPGIRILHR